MTVTSRWGAVWVGALLASCGGLIAPDPPPQRSDPGLPVSDGDAGPRADAGGVFDAFADVADASEATSPDTDASSALDGSAFDAAPSDAAASSDAGADAGPTCGCNGLTAPDCAACREVVCALYPSCCQSDAKPACLGLPIVLCEQSYCPKITCGACMFAATELPPCVDGNCTGDIGCLGLLYCYTGCHDVACLDQCDAEQTPGLLIPLAEVHALKACALARCGEYCK